MSEIKNGNPYWEQWIKQANRELANADRRWRYHNKSFDAMGEKIVARESAAVYVPLEDMILNTMTADYISQIKDIRIYHAILQLTKKQQMVLELYYWKGYQHEEIAAILGCDRSAVTKLLIRAIAKLKETII